MPLDGQSGRVLIERLASGDRPPEAIEPALALLCPPCWLAPGAGLECGGAGETVGRPLCWHLRSILPASGMIN